MQAHAWARDMGMGEQFLMKKYPPSNFEDAQVLARSDIVRRLYEEGETIGMAFKAAPSMFYRLVRGFVPQHLLPFPGGQLAAFDAMGRYADNLQRFYDHFGSSRILVLDTDELSEVGGFYNYIRNLAELVPAVGMLIGRAKKKAATSGFDLASQKIVHLNSAEQLQPPLQPSAEALAELRQYYRDHNEKLFRMIGRNLGWNA